MSVDMPVNMAPTPPRPVSRLESCAGGGLAPDSLVGSYLLGPRPGRVVAEPSPGVYLVAWFSTTESWEPVGQRLVPLSDMRTWVFFDTADEARIAEAADPRTAADPHSYRLAPAIPPSLVRPHG